MYHVLLSRLEMDLMDLTFAGEGEETAAGDGCVTPVC